MPLADGIVPQRNTQKDNSGDSNFLLVFAQLELLSNFAADPPLLIQYSVAGVSISGIFRGNETKRPLEMDFNSSEIC